MGLTQKEFAEKVGADYTYLGKVERGGQYPSLKMLERIGKAYSVPLSYFFEDDSFSKDLLKDRKRQNLLKMSRGLNSEHLDIVMQLIKILRKKGDEI